MKAWVRWVVLFVGLGVFAVQALAVDRHFHEPREQVACAACFFHASPAEKPDALVEALPPPPPAPLTPGATRSVAPPAALAPEDVSFSTSPPAA